MDIFEEKKLLKICAPMVRYSKLPFRMLVRKYNCDLTYTPMIIADSFIRSQKARDSEFTTNDSDRPLIVQFASHNVSDFVEASQLVSPYCDGVDLNCGCPQRWAMQDGYGACLLKKPQIVKDIILQTKNAVPNSQFSVSVKIRLHTDIRETVDFCRQLEFSGVTYITVHGRTKDQRHNPVNREAIRTIKQSLHIPVVANGDIKSLDDALQMQQDTNVDGVMSARGILENPALYSGYESTPLECIQDWLDISVSTGTIFTLFHRHLIYMCERNMSRAERRVFNVLGSTAAVIDYIKENYINNT